MLRIRKEAERDLKEAFEWYERQRIRSEGVD